MYTKILKKIVYVYFIPTNVLSKFYSILYIFIKVTTLLKDALPISQNREGKTKFTEIMYWYIIKPPEKFQADWWTSFQVISDQS